MQLFRAIVRVLAFLPKELFGSLRQPRLILSLVLGPFIILALFGLGFNSKSHYRTWLVLPDQPDVSSNVADYKELNNETFNLVNVSKDLPAATAALDRGDADVLVVVPANALDEIYNGRSARFPVLYRNLNPLQANYIEYSTFVYASEFDKVVLRQLLSVSKPQTSQLQAETGQLNASTATLDDAMQRNDIPQAKLQAENLKTLANATSNGLSNINPANAAPSSASDQTARTITNNLITGGVGQIQNDLATVSSKADALDAGFNRADANSAQQRANLSAIQAANKDLGDRAAKIAAIPPAVLVEPVLSEAKNRVSTPVNYINFYGPAVIILLIQHIALTLVALSNVRDKLIGAMEIFRVAPISASQILTGKFISFALLLLALAAALISLVVGFLGVPFVNPEVNWVPALAVVAVTIYASIGLGFLIGGLSQTESQAVQLSMIVLLASIFFSGFVVPLNQFIEAVRYVGYALPVTFGTEGLQRVMLDNTAPDVTHLAIGLGLGTLYLLIGRFLYHRQLDTVE